MNDDLENKRPCLRERFSVEGSKKFGNKKEYKTIDKDMVQIAT